MTRDSRIRLRRADVNDSGVVLAWRNSEDAVRYSRSSAPLDEAVHERWFKKAVASSTTLFLIAEVTSEAGVTPIGMCRFDRIKSGLYVVSIVIGDGFRGQGLGGRILRSAIRFLSGEIGNSVEIEAVVHERNEPSWRLFERVGFSLFNRIGPWLHLRLYFEYM